MASPLVKRLPRELRNNLGKYLGMFLLLTLAIAFTSGFLVAASSIELIGKNMRATVPLVGDVKVILNQLMEKKITVSCEEWRQMLRKQRQAELDRTWPERQDSVFPGRLLRLLGERLSPDAAVCVDVGQNQLWACKHLRLRGARLLTSGGLGTMGYSLPAAIGVKTAQPERETLVICGDGSFQMMMNELATVRAQGMDLKIVLLRNGVLGLVHQIQNKAPYHGAFGVELQGDPDFAVLTAAYGIDSITVTQESQVEAALDQLMAAKGSCMLIAQVSPECRTTD